MIGDFSDQAEKSMSSGIDVTCLTIGPTACRIVNEIVFVSAVTYVPYFLNPNRENIFLFFFDLTFMKFYKFFMRALYHSWPLEGTSRSENNCSGFTQRA